MNRFADFNRVAEPALEYIVELASAENMSMTKFFGKKLAPSLFEGARTGKFLLPDLDEGRNTAANERESVNTSKMSAELQEALDGFQKLCASYYESVQDTTEDQEKCMYGIRHSLLLCRTGRLNHPRVVALLEDLNTPVDSSLLAIDSESVSVKIVSENFLRTKEETEAREGIVN